MNPIALAQFKITEIKLARYKAGRCDQVDQIDCVLTEDRQSVMLWVYFLEDDPEYFVVELPSAVETFDEHAFEQAIGELPSNALH